MKGKKEPVAETNQLPKVEFANLSQDNLPKPSDQTQDQTKFEKEEEKLSVREPVNIVIP